MIKIWLTLSLPALIWPAAACGPFFPNWLLEDSGQALFSAPETRFEDELARMNLVPARFRALPATNPPQQTLEVELSDLRAALERSGLPPDQGDRLCEQHRAERLKISVFAQATNGSGAHPHFQLRPDPTNELRIAGLMPQITPGLPHEFADYLRGSVAWHQGKLPDARLAWEHLLQRPPAERHYKSTWAAYMLGRSWEDTHPRRAIRRFQEVRDLAAQGFADSLGLAVASLGWEARLHWREGHFSQAIDLYLEQAAAGDPSALNSLRFCAVTALNEGTPTLRSLARHTNAQKLVTAYVIAGGYRMDEVHMDPAVKEAVLNFWQSASTRIPQLPPPKPSWHTFRAPAMMWLEAIEDADVRDVESAEQLALAAYQMNDMERTRRWLERARITPLTQWLEAKLLLRDGKLEEGTQLLSRLVRVFPAADTPTHDLASAGLAANLWGEQGYYLYWPFRRARHQVQGELGVLQLARGQYEEALGLLLQANALDDAAYVAERVLTTDELKRCVDRDWPAPKAPAQPTETGTEESYETDAAGWVRYLLGRRLVRDHRFAEAANYLPAELLSALALYAKGVQAAAATDQPRLERARSMWEAARVARHQGMELLGTELAPDYHTYDGGFEEGPDLAWRLATTNVLAPSRDEMVRARQHVPMPNERYHYRYLAASLAMEAATLLPDNTEETARILCVAGTWLAGRDPDAADVFYKALVRRCRQTDLGNLADRMRWFPRVNETGELLPMDQQPAFRDGRVKP